MDQLVSILVIFIAVLAPLTTSQKVSPTNETSGSVAPTSRSPSDLILTFRHTPPGVPRYNLNSLVVSTDLTPSQTLNGTLTLINSNTTNQLVITSVALISCDPSAYDGYLGPVDTIAIAVDKSPVAIVLYSLASSSCTFTPGDAVKQYSYLYSITGSQDAENLVAQVSMMQVGSRDVLIGRRDTIQNGTQQYTGSQNGSPNPGGPSPSTAVAMIILYSITGVITALFLVIIITGAVRAHRHPERYGPRNVLGRTRQSRARGLARAMLDTLPIVKWGEKDDDPKATDVEMGGNAPTSTVPREAGAGNGTEKVDGPNSDTAAATQTGQSTNTDAASAEAAAKEEEQISCSICTDDFERGQDVRVLPCHHSFHPACIDPWLLNVSGTCPLCRIDLRPAGSVDTPMSPEEEVFPPPLGLHDRRASYRQSGIWDILNASRMQEATPEQRIDALRRVREQRRRSPSEEAEVRRRRRLTARLQDVFHIRTRGAQEASPETSMTGGAGATLSASPAAAISAERIPESQQESTAVSSTAASPIASGRLDTVGESATEQEAAHATKATEAKATETSASKSPSRENGNSSSS